MAVAPRLAIAAEPFLGSIGFMLISAAALFSTGSAINATLFSTARFTSRLAQNDLIPDHLSEDSDGDEPIRGLLTVGILAAGFTVVGSLQGITSFASLTFIVIMGGMNYLAISHRTKTEIRSLVPAVGFAGTVITIPLLLWHLYSKKFGVFLSVIGIVIIVITVEILYFERDWIVSEADELSDGAGSLDAEIESQTED
ncbi:APC family permease (plasmid) [Halolamina sp. CBA1230]|uniref:amino acid permease n=1 Tax=Halolamina sp. CBA1230 TaxID=1853690 RepID=UPI0009A1E7AF|nr:amino acid permease [Halolamina sp. CBA1230]QKY22081.1 APC family permease [Halolamina sp. CBA1230]